MEGEIKCTQTHVITQMKKKKEKESHCKMGSSCGLAVALLSTADGAGFILFHRQEERNPREETSVRPTQGKKKLGYMLKTLRSFITVCVIWRCSYFFYFFFANEL